MEKKRQTNRKNAWKIWLAIVSLAIGRLAIAQEATPRFFIEIDTTPHGIHREQEFEVRYICTAAFDSMTQPVFESFQEVARGPIPHKYGHAVVEGVLTDIYEQGFGYDIRFKQEGKNDLPVASVHINGKTYETPPLSVWVHPAVAPDDSLKCSLRLSETYRRPGIVDVMLTCNRRPDSSRPRLVVNGNAVEVMGQGSSLSATKDEYEFYYSFECVGEGDFSCTCENLAFGGVPYPMKEQVFTLGSKGPSWKENTSQGNDLPVIGISFLYILAAWLLLRLRFRKEGREDFASFVLRNKHLNLTTEWALTHYSLPLLLLALPVIFIGLNAYAYYVEGKSDFYFPLFWCGLLPAVLAFVLCRRQHDRLRFQPVTTSLSRPVLQAVLAETAEKHHWTVDYLGSEGMVARTNPSIWSLSGGEQVFVVFDQGQVWVNSVNDLNKRSAVVSFGHTKRNIRTVKEAIANQQAAHETAPEGEMDLPLREPE